MPAKVVALNGGFFPKFCDGEEVFSPIVDKGLEALRQLPSSKGEALASYWKDRTLARLLRRKEIDVVLAEYGPTAGAVAPACGRARIPLVAHFHGRDAFYRPMIERHRNSYERAFETAAGIVVGTDEMEEQLIGLGAPADKIHKNPCGVDVDLFRPTRPGENPPHFVALGRFVEKKAPHLTLLAFREVVQEHPEARLTMIGDGKLLEACRQMASALGLSECVEFTGVLEHEEVAEVLREARAFVQHSAQPESGDSEGTSISVLEAAATGLPVVATRHGGIRRSVLHGRTGFLVDEYDVGSMVRHMSTLAQKPDLAGELGKAGRRRVEEEYAMEGSIQGLYQVVEEVWNRVN
jgi:glycosyltransferase involved in cell wall biosynthesis